MRGNAGRAFLSYYSHLIISVCVTLCSIRLCGCFEKIYYHFEEGACPIFLCVDNTSLTRDQYRGLSNGSIDCRVSVVWKYYPSDDAIRELLSSSIGTELHSAYISYLSSQGAFFPTADKHGERTVHGTLINVTDEHVRQILMFRYCVNTKYYFKFRRGMEPISHLSCHIRYSCYDDIAVDIHHFINYTDIPQVPITHTVSVSSGLSLPHKIISKCSANNLGDGTLTIYKKLTYPDGFEDWYFKVLKQCRIDIASDSSCSYHYSVTNPQRTKLRMVCIFVQEKQIGDHQAPQNVYISRTQRVSRGPLTLTPLFNKPVLGTVYQRVFEGQQIHLECTATESVGISMYWQEGGKRLDCNEPSFDECIMSLVHVSKPIDEIPGYTNEYVLRLTFRPNRKFTNHASFFSKRQFLCVASGPNGKLISESLKYLVHREIKKPEDAYLIGHDPEDSSCPAYPQKLLIMLGSIAAMFLTWA